METISLNEFYGQSLGIRPPWKVSSVVILSELKQVHVTVECPRGIAWVDVAAGQRAEIKDWQDRQWRHLDTCEYETIIKARVPRIKLSDGKTTIVSVPWAEEGGRFTRRFEAGLIEKLRECKTVKGAARLGRVTEDQMDGVMARAVARGLDRRTLLAPRYLGIDEKAKGKGHRYITVLNNLDDGSVIEVVEERTQAAAESLLDLLPTDSLAGVEAIAMDMWPAFMNAAKEKLPKADIVFDRFHIVHHLNEAVDKVRRRENSELAEHGNDTLKKTKYLWLRARLDLRTTIGIEFRNLLNLDLQTATAWALKENFSRLWSYQSWAWALSFMDKWMEAANESGLAPMQKKSDMIGRHAERILNYLHHPITNAGSEGLNSSIQSLKHLAKGLVNFKSLRTRILFFLGKLDMCPA